MPKISTRPNKPPDWIASKGKLIWKLIARLSNNRIGRLSLQAATRFTIESTREVRIGETTFTLCAANPRLDARVTTFPTREPQMLKWIDGFERNSVFWDIGANIGLFSLYAAKVKNCRVFAFEPSVFCLEFLARNIWLNDLQDQITIIPNPLSNKTQENLLTLHSREWGDSSNSFGTSLNQDGKEIEASFNYKILGSSIDESIKNLGLPSPQYIKIDVDGIEPLILAGGSETLRKIESISVEVPTYQGANQQVSKLLNEAGLYLEISDGNQFWRRKEVE